MEFLIIGLTRIQNAKNDSFRLNNSPYNKHISNNLPNI